MIVSTPSNALTEVYLWRRASPLWREHNSHDAAEATKNICCAKNESAVDQSTVTTPLKKNIHFWGESNNTSLPFYRQNILNPNFCFSFVQSILSLFFSPINCLLTGVLFCVCLWADFYATKICIRCWPRLYIFHSLIFYSFSIFDDIKFKVSLLISLLYKPNKVLPSFCWNLHLTLVHCHKPEG